MKKEPTPIYRGSILRLNLEEHALKDGSCRRYEIVRHPGGAAALPVFDNGEILLVRQYRPALESRLLEIPAGKLEAGEAPEACITRELEEETGWVAGRLESLGSMITAPGFCDERVHLYLATDLRRGILAPDEDEEIELVRLPLERAVAMALDGTIDDGKTRLALLWYQNRLHQRTRL